MFSNFDDFFYHTKHMCDLQKVPGDVKAEIVSCKTFMSTGSHVVNEFKWYFESKLEKKEKMKANGSLCRCAQINILLTQYFFLLNLKT